MCVCLLVCVFVGVFVYIEEVFIGLTHFLRLVFINGIDSCGTVHSAVGIGGGTYLKHLSLSLSS